MSTQHPLKLADQLNPDLSQQVTNTHFISLKNWIAVLAGMLGAFMAILDIQITNASLLDILGELSATPEEGSWLTTAYLSAEIIAIPLTVLLSRVFGFRDYIVVNTFLFLCFSTMCANAWDLQSMIVFRMLQGFTGGALIPMAMSLVMLKLPTKHRATGLALFGLTATLAPTLGPICAGLLTQWSGWPWIFYINWLPGILLISGIAYGLESTPKQFNLLREADWLGIMLMAIGLASLTILLEEGPSKDWFESKFILLFFLGALFGLGGWILTQLLKPNPFINLSLFTQKNFFIATLISAVAGMGLYGSAYILPLFLSQIRDYNALQIGQVMMWVGLPQLFIMPFVAKLSTKIDNRFLCTFGLILFGLSCLMNARMDASTSYDQLILTQVIRALGQPFIMLTLSNFAMQKLSKENMGSGSSLYNMMRNLGGSVGIAMLATFLINRSHFHWMKIGESLSSYSLETQLRLSQLTQNLVHQGLNPESAQRSALESISHLLQREAYVMGYNDCFLMMGMILIGCIGLVWMSDGCKSPSQ